MLRQIIQKLLEPRHFWRNVGFDELSELYTSQLLRSLAVHLIGVFTPVYLYKIGYSLRDIALFYVGWFAVRPLFDVLGGFMVARVGPKHVMAGATIMHIGYLSLIISLETLRWPLVFVASVGTLAYSMHLIAMYVSFSKIKHSDHGGTELGYMVVMERIGAVLGPLAGGLIANYFDPRIAVGLAMLVLLISVVPLFLSAEPVRLNQNITFRGLPYKKHIRDYLAFVPATIENTISIIIWPLFISLFVLGDNTFAKLGAIAAIGTLSSLVFSRMMGLLIDKRKGRLLLVCGVWFNALLHLTRPFIGGPVSAGVVNIINEPVTAAYRMPLMKGLYDAADSVPGYRIAYLVSINVVDSLSRLLFWVLVWIGLGFIGGKSLLVATFCLAAICSLCIVVERFPALRQRV